MQIKEEVLSGERKEGGRIVQERSDTPEFPEWHSEMWEKGSLGKQKYVSFPPPVDHHYHEVPKFCFFSFLSMPNAVLVVYSCLYPWGVPARPSGLVEEGMRSNEESPDSRTPHWLVFPNLRGGPFSASVGCFSLPEGPRAQSLALFSCFSIYTYDLGVPIQPQDFKYH